MTVTAPPAVRWQAIRWADWTLDGLYEALQLRSQIFVVEQNCPFPEMDGLDPRCEHLCGYDASGALVAYSRLLGPGLKYDEASIGRVVVAESARGTQLGRALMRESIALCRLRYPEAPIRIGAQQHLSRFYGSFGFDVDSDPYLEDGIWHVEMRMPAAA